MNFAGRTEVFRHPFPRGTPIHPTPAETTAERNRARTEYLDPLVKKL